MPNTKFMVIDDPFSDYVVSDETRERVNMWYEKFFDVNANVISARIPWQEGDFIYDAEKLSDVVEKMSADFREAADALRPVFEAIGETLSGFMRSMPPGFIEASTQLGEREERKEMSRKKYERMMARRKPKRVKSRKRW